MGLCSQLARNTPIRWSRSHLSGSAPRGNGSKHMLLCLFFFLSLRKNKEVSKTTVGVESHCGACQIWSSFSFFLPILSFPLLSFSGTQNISWLPPVIKYPQDLLCFHGIVPTKNTDKKKEKEKRKQKKTVTRSKAIPPINTTVSFFPPSFSSSSLLFTYSFDFFFFFFFSFFLERSFSLNSTSICERMSKVQKPKPKIKQYRTTVSSHSSSSSFFSFPLIFSM